MSVCARKMIEQKEKKNGQIGGRGVKRGIERFRPRLTLL